MNFSYKKIEENRKENDEKNSIFGSKNDVKSVKIACSLPLLPP